MTDAERKRFAKQGKSRDAAQPKRPARRSRTASRPLPPARRSG
jgi:hypothetical protein